MCVCVYVPGVPPPQYDDPKPASTNTGVGAASGGPNEAPQGVECPACLRNGFNHSPWSRCVLMVRLPISHQGPHELLRPAVPYRSLNCPSEHIGQISLSLGNV